MFVAVEGPNGVGKSTVAAALAAALGGSGREVLLTAEPTRTALGELVRALESELEPRALALACAADRYHHLTSEVLPALRRGAWVVTDRYVQSSLVLQRLDGLDLAEVWQYNKHVTVPTLSVYWSTTRTPSRPAWRPGPGAAGWKPWARPSGS
jgi:dTMP kinase